MKIVVQFNSKSKGKGVAEAIVLAKKHRGRLQGNYYNVIFDSFQNKDLLKIKSLVGRLKDTKIFVDKTGAVSRQAAKKAGKKKAEKTTPLGWLNKDDLLTAEGDSVQFDKINETFEKAKSAQKDHNYKKAIDLYTGVLKLDHKEGNFFSDALLNIGRLYYLQNSFQETFLVFDKFFELYPDWEKDDGSEDLYLDACKKIGDTQKAKEIQGFIKVRKQKRDTMKKKTETGKKSLSEYNLDDKNEAEECYKQAIDSDIKKFDFWINLGQSLKNYGDETDAEKYYKMAIRCYEKCFEIDPNWPDAILNIGALYEHIGQEHMALDFFKASMDEDDSEEIENHERIIESNPKAIESWIAMADLYSDYEIYKPAIDCYHKAIELEPKDISLWISLGQTYLDSEDIEKALESFKNASKIDPQRRDIKLIINKIRNKKIGAVYEILESL